MNAAFGDVSADGSGTPEFDVTQTGGGPNAFVAIHSTGKVGGITLSKFSLTTIGRRQGGEQEGVGTGVGIDASTTAAEMSNRPPRMVGDDLIMAAVSVTRAAAPIVKVATRLI